MYDVIVIGGGPAGMTAALYALRNGKTALVIEKAGFGGQITHSPKVENYPGTLSSLRDEGDKKVVVTEEGGEYEGKTVVIATGVKHRMLGLEGEDELVGEGISFCAVCDGDFYAGRKVCVAGGGNSALQEAILLSEKCSDVIMLQDLPYFTGEGRLQDVLFSRPNVKKRLGVKITSLITEGGELRGVRISGEDGEEEIRSR